MARATWLICLVFPAVTAVTVIEDAPKPEPVKNEPAKVDPDEIVVAGQIAADDPRDRFQNQPSKMHAVRLEKGKPYIIELTSPDFQNPFVRVEDTVGNQVGQPTFGGANRISRIRMTAPKDDTYLIYVMNFNNQPGKYTLTVKPFVRAAVKTVVLVPPLPGQPSEAKGTLAVNDPPSEFRDHPCKTYTVELKRGKNYQFDMVSGQFDTYLILQDPNGILISQDDDSGGNLNSRIQFNCNLDGHFRLVATTFNGNVGMFTLRVTEK